MHKKPPHPPVVPPRRAQLHREVKTPLPLLNTKTKPAKPSSILPGIVLVFLFCLIGVFFYESHQATLLATQSRQELKLLRQESNLRIRARQAAANGSVKVQPPRVEPEPTVGGGDKESVDPVAEAELRPRGSIEAVFQTKDSFPVSGVEVEFVFANTIKGGKPAPRYKAITDSEGIVRFSEVVAGTYTVKSDRQNYKPRHGKEHSVQEGVPGKRAVFEMVSNLKYGGIVQDIRKRPMVGAEVELLALSHVLESSTGTSIRSERSYRKTKASGKGSFELPEVYEGLNLLRVTYPGYVPHSSEFTLLSSRTNELIILEPASVLGGLVRSTEGLPLGGATLQLTSEKNAKFTQEVGTLPNGRFLFNSIPDSHTFTLGVSLKGYLPEKLTDIPAGRENLVIELEAGGSISGTVRNFSTQAPESGIAILLIPSVEESEFSERRTVSDSSGRYEFTELPAGQYDVRVQSEKLTATPHLGVTVASGKRTDKIDFSVYPGQEIRGLVLDEATGERIVAATVSLQSSVGPQFLEKGSDEARTDESGQFVFRNLPSGLYTLSATAEGYRQIP
ncbi:MAG: carboxypeptidase-like regulatory domain-containing protein, partial [Candidatus Sumerlaeia bacterium]|nr:carboxypeptidase-like regulatory domain-containing protein [Candidatus Sumerlaeia bacterium]